MYENAAVISYDEFNSWPHDFAQVELPDHWDGRRTVQVTTVEGDQAMMTVAPEVERTLRRAVALTRAGLCERLDLRVDSSGLRIIAVYWES